MLNCHPKNDGRLVRFARSRPLVLFFALAYAIAWVLFLPLVLSRTGLGLIPIIVPIEYSVAVSVAPSIAALLTQWLAERNWRAFKLYRSWRSLLIGALSGVVLIEIACVIVPGILLAKGAPGTLNWRVFGSLAVYNWSTFLGGPLGEEPGWRGFALPRLQASLGPLRASLVLGCLWAAWHLPAFLIPTWTSVTFWVYVPIVVGTTTLMTLGANLAGFGAIAAVIMHAAFNTCSRLLNGLLASAEIREDVPPEVLFALSSVAVAGLAVIFTRGRLGASADHPR